MKLRIPGWRRVDFGLLKEILREFRFLLEGQRGSMFSAFGLTILVAILELLRPWPLKFALDKAVILSQATAGELHVSQFLPSALGLIAIAATLAVVQYGRAVTVAGIGRRAATRLRRHLFQHLHRLSFPFHLAQRTGDLLVRLMGDVNMVRDLVFASWIGLLSQIITIVLVLTILVVWSPWLALASLSPLPLLFWFGARSSKKLNAVTRKQRKKEGEAASFAAESLAQIRLVKSYAWEDSMARFFGQRARSSERAGAKAAGLAAKMAGIGEVLTGCGLAAVLLLGASEVSRGNMTAGTLVVIVSYVRLLYKPLRGMTKEGSRVARATACAERILDILRQTPENGQEGASASQAVGDISFDSVSYSWDAGGRGVKDVTMRIPLHSITLIQGPNGSGKSTTLALLLRLLKPDRNGGRILMNGVDIETFSLDSYRRRFAYVPQQIHLLKGTIRENLAYGLEGVTDADLHEASGAAGFDDVLARFRTGLDTPLGERGETLSGGEARRLMLARAAVRDAPYLLLDEPLEGLDTRARAEVAASIQKLAEGRTVIAISHGAPEELRPTHIVRLKEGVVVREDEGGSIP
ncbi:MAG TPA: ABC transporter ATP-binding protein [Planctomycetota bacterium]|nr:ABC transporter ATP-binding protein [Planctomycetota bacterium]